MNWSLIPHAAEQAQQDTFIGGTPSLPADQSVPTCSLCQKPQTFYWQIAFSTELVWSGRTLATFGCTSCADESHLIPEMLDGQLRGAAIPGGFLDRYQRNFAFVVFDTAEAVTVPGYDKRIAFRELRRTPGAQPDAFAVLGGTPNWLLGDEAPSSYLGRVPMVFLLQTVGGHQFSLLDSAPPQIELDLRGAPTECPLRSYQLFLGNSLYLYGTSVGPPLVYAVTQT